MLSHGPALGHSPTTRPTRRSTGWGLGVRQAKAADEALAKAEETEKKRKAEGARAAKERAQSGPTPQPNLPIVERPYLLDDADRACPSCGGELRPMAGQFEESELIDVIEARYELVRVKQQKYVCRCGGCVETALGPERASPSVRVLSRSSRST